MEIPEDEFAGGLSIAIRDAIRRATRQELISANVSNSPASPNLASNRCHWFLRNVDIVWLFSLGLILLGTETYRSPTAFAILFLLSAVTSAGVFLFGLLNGQSRGNYALEHQSKYMRGNTTRPETIQKSQPDFRRLLKPYALSPTALCQLILFGIVLFSVWVSPMRTDSWMRAAYLLYALTVYQVILNRTPTVRLLAWSVLTLQFCGIGIAVAGPLVTDWKSEFRLFHLPVYNWLARINLPLEAAIHANILAGVLVIILPLSVALLLWPQSMSLLLQALTGRHSRSLAIGGYGILVVGTVLMSFVLILTQSRGAYLAVGCGIFVVLLLRVRRLVWSLPFLMIAAAIGLRQYGLIEALSAISNASAFGGWAGRVAIWRTSLMALEDFGITGIGIGTFSHMLPRLYPLDVSIDIFPHSHNLLLQIGLDLGIGGLVAFLAVQILLICMLTSLQIERFSQNRTGRKNSRRHSIRFHERDVKVHYAVGSGALGSLVGMHIHGLIDAATWGNKLAFVPWILYALIVVTYLSHVSFQVLAHGYEPRFQHAISSK